MLGENIHFFYFLFFRQFLCHCILSYPCKKLGGLKIQYKIILLYIILHDITLFCITLHYSTLQLLYYIITLLHYCIITL